MKTKEINFKGILFDHEAVMGSFRDAGVKARIIWQFGEPVEVEDAEGSDFSIPLVNSTVNRREFFWL